MHDIPKAHLRSILDEPDEQVVAGGPLVAAVQAIRIPIHSTMPRLCQQHPMSDSSQWEYID